MQASLAELSAGAVRVQFSTRLKPALSTRLLSLHAAMVLRISPSHTRSSSARLVHAPPGAASSSSAPRVSGHASPVHTPPSETPASPSFESPHGRSGPTPPSWEPEVGGTIGPWPNSLP